MSQAELVQATRSATSEAEGAETQAAPDTAAAPVATAVQETVRQAVQQKVAQVAPVVTPVVTPVVSATQQAVAQVKPAVAPVVTPVVTAAGQAAAQMKPAVAAAARAERDLQIKTVRQTVPRRTAVQRALTFRNAALVALAGFATMVYVVRQRRPLSWDVRVTRALQHVTAAPFAWLMYAVSVPGFPPTSQILVGSVASFLWLSGLRLESAFACSTWGAGLVSTAVKLVMRRPRPAAPTVIVRSRVAETSFPSGHTVNYTTFFGYLLFLAFTLLKPGKLRAGLMGLFGSLVALVGPSRIYQGHHWVSDVMAAYCLGLAWLLSVTESYRRLKARPRDALPAWLRPPVRRSDVQWAAGSTQ